MSFEPAFGAESAPWSDLLHAPVRIGAVSVAPRLVLSPMAGLTDMVWRRIVKRIGGVGLTVSEIISSNGLVFGHDRTRMALAVDPADRPVSLQISGGEPERMAEAARTCAAEGPDLIDINMGCPAKKVNRSEAGCALMRDPALAAAIVRAVVRAVDCPVTVKMRLGYSDDHLNFREVARACVDEGAAMIAVHGRTRRQMFTGSARWEPIAELKAELAVPVFANGDIDTAAKVRYILQDLGLDGAFIGRAAIRNPWIFRQICEAAAGETPALPSPGERRAVMLHHFELLLAGESPREALHKMKTFLGKYTKEFPGAADLRRRLSAIRDPEQLYREAAAAFPFERLAAAV